MNKKISLSAAAYYTSAGATDKAQAAEALSARIR
jgi:hypothetical protein